MTSSTEYIAMTKEGKKEAFLNHQLKVILLKNIDDPRFSPIIKSLINEEIQSMTPKVVKLYEERKNTEALQLENKLFIYAELLAHISN